MKAAKSTTKNLYVLTGTKDELQLLLRNTIVNISSNLKIDPTLVPKLTDPLWVTFQELEDLEKSSYQNRPRS